MYAALSEHIGSVPSRPITDIHGQTEDHDTRGPTAPTLIEPPIDYDGKWAETLKGSTRSLAAILRMPDTSGLWALWFENQASREILEEWAGSGSSSDYIGRGASFPSMWRFLGPGKEVIQGHNPPQASDLAFSDNGVYFKCALKLWYLYRLMKAVPELHRKSDLEAFKIDAYDLFNADKVLSFFKRRHGENLIGDKPPKAFVSVPIIWHTAAVRGRTATVRGRTATVKGQEEEASETHPQDHDDLVFLAYCMRKDRKV